MSNEPTARFQMPDLLERGMDNTFTLDAWYQGALITDAATTGTFTLFDPSGVAKIGPSAFAVGSLKPSIEMRPQWSGGSFTRW